MILRRPSIFKISVKGLDKNLFLMHTMVEDMKMKIGLHARFKVKNPKKLNDPVLHRIPNLMQEMRLEEILKGEK